MSCLIIGSLHVLCLEAYIKSHHRHNFYELQPNNVDVKFCGISGGKVCESSHIRRFKSVIASFHPSKLFVQIGGNDLDTKDADLDTAHLIVCSIVAICKLFIARYQLQHIFVGQLLFRHKTKWIPVHRYNELVVELNRQELKFEKNICYWRLKSLKNGNVFRDLVHLSDSA